MTVSSPIALILFCSFTENIKNFKISKINTKLNSLEKYLK